MQKTQLTPTNTNIWTHCLLYLCAEGCLNVKVAKLTQLNPFFQHFTRAFIFMTCLAKTTWISSFMVISGKDLCASLYCSSDGPFCSCKRVVVLASVSKTLFWDLTSGWRVGGGGFTSWLSFGENMHQIISARTNSFVYYLIQIWSVLSSSPFVVAFLVSRSSCASFLGALSFVTTQTVSFIQIYQLF